MRRIFVFLFYTLLAVPAISDTECPVGYGLLNYTRLEYIESTGTQYIDTGFNPNGKQSIRIIHETLYTSGWGVVFGVANSTDTVWFNEAIGNSRIWHHLGTSANIASLSNISSRTFYKVDFNWTPSNVSVYYNNSTIPVTSTIAGVTIDGTLYMFAGRYGTTSKNFLNGMIKYMKIYADGELVRDFIPVKRESDGEIGMYDLVEGKFYGNDGTGKFIAGPHTGESVGVEDGICSLCPPNTYKDSVGNSECTPCPSPLMSPQGSTSVNDCGRVLWVGNKIFFMSSAPRTTHTLNVMDSEGNIFYGNLYSEQ